MENLIGKTLGQYEIREKIGEGGMAYVFKAYQPSLDRFVAVKVLSLAVAEKARLTERFQREAYSIARLHHPNILQVHDFGIQDNYNYIVMRYVEHSRTLGHLIEAKTPLDKLINYIIQVADALNYAHEQGIIHRDVKPSNILIDGKWALLSDFGLVKMSETATQLTSTGLSMGTPAYMSPEQVEGINVDYRTDIYALGVILYKILTGTIPHDAPTPIGILVKRRTEPVPALRQIKPDIPVSLEHVTLRSLAMKPDERYSSATDFAEALSKAQTDPNYREQLNGSGSARRDRTLLDDITLPHIRGAALRENRGLMVSGVMAALVVIGALVFPLLFLREGNGSSAIQPIAQTPTSDNSGTPIVPSKTETPPSTATLSNISEATEVHNLPTAPATATPTSPVTLAPDTPTPTSTSTPKLPTSTATSTPKLPTSTPNPLRSTATPTLAAATAIPKAPAPTATPAPSIPIGQFTLLRPTIDDTSTGPTEFEWRWDGPLGPDQGFEVRVWREGEPPAGAHNAVEDNKNGYIAAVGNNIYRVTLNIKDAAGVLGRGGDYLWTVVLVQISPDYKDLGIQASPGHLRLGLGGGGGGGDNGGGEPPHD